MIGKLQSDGESTNRFVVISCSAVQSVRHPSTMLIVRGAVESSSSWSSSFVEQFVRGAVRSMAEIEDVDILVSINLPFSDCLTQGPSFLQA